MGVEFQVPLASEKNFHNGSLQRQAFDKVGSPTGAILEKLADVVLVGAPLRKASALFNHALRFARHSVNVGAHFS
jgi:hypothetical protein